MRGQNGEQKAGPVQDEQNTDKKQSIKNQFILSFYADSIWYNMLSHQLMNLLAWRIY